MDFNSFYKSNLQCDNYLIEGNDDFLKNLAIKKIKNQYNIEDLDFVELNEDVNWELINSSIEPIPFFSLKRLVVVYEFYPKTKESKFLSDLLNKNNNGNTILIFCNKNSNDLLKNTQIEYVNSNKSEEFLQDYLAKLFKDNNLKVDTITISTIIEYCSCEAYKVDAEANKLIGFCLNKKEITLKDVQEIVNKDLDYKIYELTECIASKRPQKAYEIINDMLNKNEPAHKLFTSIYNHFSRLFYCRLCTDINELVSCFGIKEYAVKKAIESSKKFTPKRLKDIVDKFAEYDFSVKSGKIDINNALWLSVFQIAIS